MARDPGTGSRRQRPIAFSSPPPKRSFWDKLPGSKIVAQGTKDVGHIVRSAPSGLRDSWDELTAGPKERKQKGYTGNPLLNQAKDMAGIARHPLRNPGYTLALLAGAAPAGKALSPKLPKRPIMNRPKPSIQMAKPNAGQIRASMERSVPDSAGWEGGVGGLVGRSADKIDAADLLALKQRRPQKAVSNLMGPGPGFMKGPSKPLFNDRFDSLKRFPDIDNDPYVKYGDQSQEGHPRHFDSPELEQDVFDDGPSEDWLDVENENPFDWRPGDEFDDIEAKQDFSVTPGGGDPDLDTALPGSRDRALIEFLSEQYGGIHPRDMDRFQNLSQRDAWRADPNYAEGAASDAKIMGNRAQDDYANRQFDQRNPLKRIPRNVRKLNMDDLFRYLERGHFGPN